ncbi:MAG: hypothetical protein WBB28_28705 [Crinalium sp.]
MKLAIDFIKKISLRKVFNICLGVMALLIVNGFSYSTNLLALAEDTPPIPDHYLQLKLTAENIKHHTEKSSGEFLGDNAQYQVEKAIDRTRDQLSTDKPVTEKAKDLADLVTGKANKNQD